MNHQDFVGGWYADALPTGERAVLFPFSRIVQTHERDLPTIAGDYPLFLDSFADGNGYKVAGKGHDSYTTWEWLYTQWVPHEEAIGNFSVIYDHAGVLHISKAGPIGVQGWRQEFEGALIAGDESYGPLVTSTNPPNGLTEFSKLGDGLSIGQGWQTGGVCVWDGAALRLLIPGACYDVKAKRLGNVVAIAFYDVEPDGLTAHIITATMDELRALPPVAAPVKPPPIVVPPPPEPKPMSGITDAQFATLVSVRAKYGETLDENQIGALLNEVAWIHRSEGVGMQRKDGGTNATQPRTGIKVWRGMRFAGNIGQDVLGQASVGKCIPTRGTAGPADVNTFVAPVEPEGVPEPVPVPTPTPVPVPTPTPTPSGDYEARIHLLEQTVSRILSVMHSV